VHDVWRDAWTSLRSTISGITGAVALGLALLGSLWDPGIKVQVGLIWLAVFALLALSVLVTAIHMMLKARQAAEELPPKAIHAFAGGGGTVGEGFLTLVMSRSRHFGVNILVTMYYTESVGSGRDDVIERSIGIGQVINIQANGLIQVLVLREVANSSELWQRIRNREPTALSHIIIKPSVGFNEVRFYE
jgi:hypothetical protein